jgi:hypothetical protein
MVGTRGSAAACRLQHAVFEPDVWTREARRGTEGDEWHCGRLAGTVGAGGRRCPNVGVDTSGRAIVVTCLARRGKKCKHCMSVCLDGRGSAGSLEAASVCRSASGGAL